MIHTFTVNVPNPTAEAVIASLSLEPAERRVLNNLAMDLPRNSLKVLRTAISLSPCAFPDTDKLEVRLLPFASIDVYVQIETAAPTTGPGIASVHVIDQRPDGRQGGVLVIAADPPIAEPAGQTVGIKNACPVVIYGGPYAVEPDQDPSVRPSSAGLPAGLEFDLVIPVTNLTGRGLSDVQVYLEHLGRCDAQFQPALWNIGIMKPNDVFFATWRVTTAPTSEGTFQASVVATSRRTNPIRLMVSMGVTDKVRG